MEAGLPGANPDCANAVDETPCAFISRQVAALGESFVELASLPVRLPLDIIM